MVTRHKLTIDFSSFYHFLLDHLFACWFSVNLIKPLFLIMLRESIIEDWAVGNMAALENNFINILSQKTKKSVFLKHRRNLFTKLQLIREYKHCDYEELWIDWVAVNCTGNGEISYKEIDSGVTSLIKCQTFDEDCIIHYDNIIEKLDENVSDPLPILQSIIENLINSEKTRRTNILRLWQKALATFRTRTLEWSRIILNLKSKSTYILTISVDLNPLHFQATSRSCLLNAMPGHQLDQHHVWKNFLRSLLLINCLL